MATNSNWTVVFDDKMIIKQKGNGANIAYTISDYFFWSQSKFSNIWSIQYGTSVSTDEVEYKDNTPHSEYSSEELGSFNEFITRWDSAHLATLQSNWDNNNAVDKDGNSIETEDEKITRLGGRPTSYSSL